MLVDCKLTIYALDFRNEVVELETVRGKVGVCSVSHETIFKALNDHGNLSSLPDITHEIEDDMFDLLANGMPEYPGHKPYDAVIETEGLCGGTVKFSALFSSHEIKFNWEII